MEHHNRLERNGFCDFDKPQKRAYQKALRLSLTAPSISADHQALGRRLMRPKGMEDLAAFSAREVKTATAEERNDYFSAEGQ